MKAGLLAVFLTAGAPAAASVFGAPGSGTASAQFLELGVGARAVAMGEAYAAVADDATALYWNPAGLVRIKERSVSLMHAPYLGQSYFDSVDYAQRVGARAAFGLGAQYFSAGDLAQTDAAGGDLGSATPYDLAVTLGFAYALTGPLDGWAAGAAVKEIESKIVHAARTQAVDAGLLTPKLLDGRLTLALTMTNLGGTLRYDVADEPLPFQARLAGAYRAGEHALLTADVGVPRGERPFLALGTEYRVRGAGTWSYAGRAGFNTRTLGSPDGFTGASVGLGLGFGAYAVDYAFVPLGGVGQTHRISLTCAF